MQPVAEQIAPLGSQQWLDQLNLAYHHEVAARLLADPEQVLAIAREDLRRWLSNGAAPWFEEWKRLLATRSLAELVVILAEDSDEGQRLRQSSPFVGVLSKAERDALFDEHERRATLWHKSELRSALLSKIAAQPTGAVKSS